MTTGEVDIELPAARMQLTAEQAQFDALEPHRTIALDGVLCSGQACNRWIDCANESCDHLCPNPGYVRGFDRSILTLWDAVF